MDYVKLINEFSKIACVLSTGKNPEGKDCIVIAAANKPYLESVNASVEDFTPNLPYTNYIKRDRNFEYMFQNCVSSGSVQHQYVNAELYNAWLDIYMIPMEKDENGDSKVLFTYELTIKADSDKMAQVSAQTASMVLKTCLKLRETDDFKKAINGVIKDIRSQCESSGCSILLTDFEERKCEVLAVDFIDDFGPKDEDAFFKPEFFNIVETWRNYMEGSNCCVVRGEAELQSIKRKAPEWYESLVFSHVNSLVLYPLRNGSKLFGYILVTNFNTDKVDFIREIMELNAFVLSSEIANYKMRTKLELMGKTDLLTGVLNRNAMNNRISDFVDKNLFKNQSIGLIFIDLNGLKETNDTKGHKAGDDMLKAVANKLKGIFANQEIYRVGGDEFLILAPDIDEDYFRRLEEELRSKSRVPGEPSFAMGSYYDDKGIDIRKALQIADGNMYKDKAEFYKSHPKMDRRNR
ncbi:MAG: GGDEF domain-containing protein [Lachnospiraceae bacterium]|nr:GGDEF domain-containing protein [Lachnospiraceae bacterium]